MLDHKKPVLRLLPNPHSAQVDKRGSGRYRISFVANRTLLVKLARISGELGGDDGEPPLADVLELALDQLDGVLRR